MHLYTGIKCLRSVRATHSLVESTEQAAILFESKATKMLKVLVLSVILVICMAMSVQSGRFVALCLLHLVLNFHSEVFFTSEKKLSGKFHRC